jgi:DNA-binding NarL/FixJ family response regulator
MNDPQRTHESNARPIRVLIADDTEIVRCTISRLIGILPHLELVGAATDGSEAVEMATALRPDLVLMDLDMPGLSGLQTAALIRQANPAVRTLIVTGYDSDEVRAVCSAGGADGFVSKWRLWHDLEPRIAEVFPQSAHPGREERATPCEARTGYAYEV